jgi:hypothetical protein
MRLADAATKSLIVAACVAAGSHADAQRPRHPLPLDSAVQEYVRQQGVLDTAAFRSATVDLDGDGNEDALVLLKGSTGCDDDGCRLLILRGSAEGFVLLSASAGASAPIRVSADARHEWKTLIVHSKGRGDVLMRFDGSRYPANASLAPRAPRADVNAARVIIE